MDKFGGPGPCGDPRNVATSDPTIIKPYWDLAAAGAIADRYFQPVVGQSSSNDMYMARADFVFDDNALVRKARSAWVHAQAVVQKQYPDPTIGDLLDAANVPWTYYAGGYAAQAAATRKDVRSASRRCTALLNFYPCTFDPSDVPFEYYATTRDNPAHIADDTQFFSDLQNGTLPAVSFVRAIGYLSEHPGKSHEALRRRRVRHEAIAAVEPHAIATRRSSSSRTTKAADTSITSRRRTRERHRLQAVRNAHSVRRDGPFAKKNFVSHVVMEHSSFVKFIEWNFLGGTTGQLGTRDTVVNNIGDLLDPTAVGATVPN